MLSTIRLTIVIKVKGRLFCSESFDTSSVSEVKHQMISAIYRALRGLF